MILARPGLAWPGQARPGPYGFLKESLRIPQGILKDSLRPLHYTTLHYTILYYTILYYTILYYTILYCTILFGHTSVWCPSLTGESPKFRTVQYSTEKYTVRYSMVCCQRAKNTSPRTRNTPPCGT